MLCDRSSAPARPRDPVPAERTSEIERLRRQRMTGPQIARQLAMPRSTVGVVLRRLGLGRLRSLDPKPPVVRYQRARPGELIHIDTKKLGRIDGIGHRITGYHTGVNRNRGIGWDVLHVCIDDASRLAYTEILPDEKKPSAIAFLDRALGWFARHGITVERVMTDNGSAYRSHDFRAACGQAGLRHIRTRPYTPRTNGKAERFIQTSLREWAYARAYQSSAERGQAMHPWITDYNHARPHSALGGQPPASKLNNLHSFDT
jgi:transposase InsO family protein